MITIQRDNFTDCPRDNFDHDGTRLIIKENRYISIKPEPALEEPCFRFRVYAHIHSGVCLSLQPFTCPWDSGQIGWFHVCKRLYPDIEQAQQIAESDIWELNQWISGDVWGYVIDDDDGQFVDSCHGFYGQSYAIEQATESYRHFFPNAEKEPLIQIKG